MKVIGLELIWSLCV